MNDICGDTGRRPFRTQDIIGNRFQGLRPWLISVVPSGQDFVTISARHDLGIVPSGRDLVFDARAGKWWEEKTSIYRAI